MLDKDYCAGILAFVVSKEDVRETLFGEVQLGDDGSGRTESTQMSNDCDVTE